MIQHWPCVRNCSKPFQVWTQVILTTLGCRCYLEIASSEMRTLELRTYQVQGHLQHLYKAQHLYLASPQQTRGITPYCGHGKRLSNTQFLRKYVINRATKNSFKLFHGKTHISKVKGRWIRRKYVPHTQINGYCP